VFAECGDTARVLPPPDFFGNSLGLGLRQKKALGPCLLECAGRHGALAVRAV